jgi:hypothetical protein
MVLIKVENKSMYSNKNIVTCTSIAAKRVAKHILAAKDTQATIEELSFLCNDDVNTPL